MYIKEERPRTGWEALYDFLNDIFATLIPGGFFLSYFLFVVIILINSLGVTGDFIDKLGIVFALIVGALAYCFGAFFQRREIKIMDRKSARHIYHKMPHTSHHAFAFANALTDEYVTRLFRLAEFFIYINDLRSPWSWDSMSTCNSSQSLEQSVSQLLTPYVTAERDSQAIPVLCTYLLNKMLLVDDRANAEYDMMLEHIDDQIRRTTPFTLKESVEKILYHSGKIQLLSRRSYSYDEADEWKKLSKFLCKRMSPKTSLVKTKNNYKALTKFLKILSHELLDSKKTRRTFCALAKIQNFLAQDINGTVDWPYTHMKRYCEDRGLEFTDEVTWGDGAVRTSVIDEIGLTTDQALSDEINRSKSRINTEKMKIAIQEPELYRSISKNEAHIRFINSLWYSTHLVIFCSGVFGFIAIAMFLYELVTGSQTARVVRLAFLLPKGDILVGLIAVSLLYISACLYIWHSGREILNYQRVREITMILQALHIMKHKRAEEESAILSSAFKPDAEAVTQTAKAR